MEKVRPTVDELEKILSGERIVKIEIMPNGEIKESPLCKLPILTRKNPLPSSY